MLINEKVNQAKEILNEFDIDCWITFARESQINGDPTLAFLISGEITWHSAFIISKSGETHAIVGKYRWTKFGIPGQLQSAVADLFSHKFSNLIFCFAGLD